MMTASRRPSYWQTKSSKDIEQAHQLFIALLELRPGDISLAWEAVQKQPGDFKKAVKDSWKKLDKVTQKRLNKEAGIKLR